MTIDIRDLQQHLQEVLRTNAAGQEVIIYDGVHPRARLVPLPPQPVQRKADLHPGAIVMSPDFDASLPDEFWTNEATA